MFGTSRFASGAPAQDDTFEMGSRSFSSDGASSSHSSAVEDTLEVSEPPIPRTTFPDIPPLTHASAATPIDAPENKRKFTGTASSPSRLSFSFASLFMRPRKQRQPSTSSLSSVDSTELS